LAEVRAGFLNKAQPMIHGAQLANNPENSDSWYHAGIAVPIIDQATQMGVLAGSFKSDAPTPVGSHLRPPREDVLHPHSHAADDVVSLLLGWTQSMTPGGFEHEELLRVERMRPVHCIYR
jgi:hypothetical protein